MVVQHNLTAMNANRYFGINNSKLSKSLEKLSSGYAINRAGDNAAGLAVSEKMRSQIGGLTQAVKNAQDGISMVQTYEGALTETDSILQRMKVLATQSANGSYDDPIDRNAIEQEFLQLNDELDQIADTDFNGVVVLNGGVMADGVSADANGLIDYAAAAKAAAAEAAKKPIDIGGSDLMNTVDDLKYDGDAANAVWSALNLSGNTESVDVTFKLASDGTTWEAVSSSKIGENGDLSNLTGTTVDATDASGKGGFKISAVAANDVTEKNGDVLAAGNDVNDVDDFTNVIFDQTTAKAGDTITLTFTRTSTSNYAPDNIGFENASGTKSDLFADSMTADATASTIALDAGITDDAMNATIAEGLEKLNGTKLVVGYGHEAGADATTAGAATYALQNQLELEDAGFTITQDTTNKNQFTISYKGTDLATFTAAAGTNAEQGTTAVDAATSNSTITYEIALDAFKYEENATQPYSVSVKAPESEESYKVSDSNAFGKSEAKMTYTDSITLQVGARTKDAVNFTFAYKSTSMGDLKADLNCTAEGLGTDKLTLSTQEDANYAIDKIDQAINKVSMVRGTFGAIQNRLEHKIDNLNVTTENLTSAESRIRDTNMAEEMMNFTKQQILSQASQSMLAQANQLPQGVLSLLQ